MFKNVRPLFYFICFCTIFTNAQDDSRSASRQPLDNGSQNILFWFMGFAGLVAAVAAIGIMIKLKPSKAFENLREKYFSDEPVTPEMIIKPKVDTRAKSFIQTDNKEAKTPTRANIYSSFDTFDSKNETLTI